MHPNSMSGAFVRTDPAPSQTSAQPSRRMWREAGLIIFLLCSWLFMGNPPSEIPLLPYFKPEKVSRVALTRPFDRLVFTKTASLEEPSGGWASEAGEAASPGLIHFLLSEIASAKVYGRLPSAKPSELGFDSAALTIALTEGDKIRKITVGALNAYLQQYYVRVDDDEQIFLSKGSFVPLALRPRQDLLVAKEKYLEEAKNPPGVEASLQME